MQKLISDVIPIEALIFAAGFGSRVRKTIAIPNKCLLPINDEPMIVRSIRLLIECGITRVLVVTGFNAQAVVSTIEAHRHRLPDQDYTVEFLHNSDYSTHGTASSFFVARHTCWPYGMLTIVGDLVYEKSLISRFVNSIMQHQRLVNLVATCSRRGSSGMRVRLSIQRIIEEFSFDLDDEDLVEESIGLTFYTEALVLELFEQFRLSPLSSSSALRDYLHDRMKSGLRLTALSVDSARYIEVDTPHDYALAVNAFMNKLDSRHE